VASAEGLKHLLERCRISLGSDQGLKLLDYLALLEKWNARVNLTASTDWDALHPFFEEAIWASGFYPKGSIRHLDIGSGAGFPAIPIRILAPQMKLEMVESRTKRAFFLEKAAAELELAGTQVYQSRVEKLLEGNRGMWDCFSWKGIKLSKNVLENMCNHARSESLFWMFHGKELAVHDANAVGDRLEIVRKEEFPGRNEWELTIYKIRVSSSGFPVSG
jgi:16S rRNA (guanine(527)-N(7))-methyltransferase RsmG